MKKEGNLVLSGRSGCKVEIIKNDGATVVRKSSFVESYNTRLIRQVQKQKSFIPNSIFNTPEVLYENSDDPFYFDMEYIPGEKYSDLFIRLSKNDLDIIVKHLIKYFDDNLKQSIKSECDISVFKNKAESLKKELSAKGKLDSYINMVLDGLIFDIPHFPFPFGYCHGDFTFSNMIFLNGSVFLVDFLDSFINSPLIDLVKLRQDTCFKWTLLIDNETEHYKRDKSWQIMNYFDNIITDHFFKNPFYIAWYTYLQKFNLLRILPYLSEKKEIQIIINSLKTL